MEVEAMKRGRRILAATITFCMAVGMIGLPVGLRKVCAEVFDDYEYVILGDGTVEITKYSGEDGYLTIPEEIDERVVSSIGEHAFSGRLNLMEIDMSDNITNIGDYAFSECEKLTIINLSSGITNIGEGAFSECALVEISIPDGVTSIRDFTFLHCEWLESVYIPDGVTSIGCEAFDECKCLKEINIPDSVTSIGESAFQCCTELEQVNIPNGVTSIGEATFNTCTRLKKVNIPVSVLSIGRAAFNSCRSLIDIYYAGTKLQWDKIKINSEYNQYMQNASIHFSDDEILNPNDFAYNIMDDGTIEIIQYRGSGKVVEIPSEIDQKRVTRIGEYAFLDCGNFTEVIIPKGIKSIEKGAFYNCVGLEKIVIPEGVVSIGEDAFQTCQFLREVIIPDSLTSIGSCAFLNCIDLSEIVIPEGVTSIGNMAFGNTGLIKIKIPNSMTNIGIGIFSDCQYLEEIVIPNSIMSIENNAFSECSGLKDVYYSGTKEQWGRIEVGSVGNELLKNAILHFKGEQIYDDIEETIYQAIENARQELERLKSGDPLSIKQDFQHYLSAEQIDIVESCLYTWLAEINYAYRYAGSSGIKERIMKKAGIDPQGDFTSGTEQAITHISVETKYGPKTFEVTLTLGAPDGSGNLYPAYGVMQYEILEKDSIPSEIPKSGQIGKASYTEMGVFAECVSKASEDSLHSTFQWESLSDEMASGILMDKTATEIIGNKNGSFTDGTFIVYVKPLTTYSKIVTISCPVDVYVYSMDGKEAGSIIDNEPNGGNQNVRLDVEGDSKKIYLTGNDYYLNLRGTDTGTMKYEVEEIANKEVRRNVQFLELQLEKDMQYEGYVFRPLNIDRDLYALRTVGGSSQEVFYPDKDNYNGTLSIFKRVEGLSLSQQKTALDMNKTVQLNASLFPLDASNPNLRWSTADESIARVDSSGLVTAVRAGSTTVMVSTKDGSFLKQYCVIDVAEEKGGNDDDFGGGSTGGSSGWFGGGYTPPVEQDKTPVVVNLHYVLQFQPNGGTDLSRRTMTLLADDSPGIMPKVKRKDYTFNGWYTQQDGGTQVTGDKPLKEAVTLYAHWTKTAIPAAPETPALKSKKKGLVQVEFKTVTGAAGYQIEYSADKQFTSVKTKETGASVKTKTITGLKAGKKYYVRIRAYNLDSMKNRIYGAYSAVKSVKVKG